MGVKKMLSEFDTVIWRYTITNDQATSDWKPLDLGHGKVDLKYVLITTITA